MSSTKKFINQFDGIFVTKKTIFCMKVEFANILWNYPEKKALKRSSSSLTPFSRTLTQTIYKFM
jgi:hypothetical protein